MVAKATNIVPEIWIYDKAYYSYIVVQLLDDFMKINLYKSLFPRGKGGRGVMLTTHPF